MKLKHPIDKGDGTSITSLTFRRPKGKDMIAIGDYLPVLTALNDGAPDGETEGEMTVRLLKKTDAKAYEAMVKIVGQLGGIGFDAAGELDFEDLTTAIAEAFEVMGEATGDGAATSGASPSPTPPSS